MVLWFANKFSKKNKLKFEICHFFAAMLKNYIEQELRKNLDFEPTPGQEILLVELSGYIGSPGNREIFLIKGYAGTGKTTIVNALVRTLAVLSRHLYFWHQLAGLQRCCPLILVIPPIPFIKKSTGRNQGRDGLGNFVLDRNLQSNTFFIVDEASMIGDRNPESIFSAPGICFPIWISMFIPEPIAILFSSAILPSFRRSDLTMSPALDTGRVESMGFHSE